MPRDNVLFAVEGLIALIAIALALGAGVAGFFLGRATAGSNDEPRPAATTSQTTAQPSASPGKQIFASAGCGGCHTLEAADAHGNVGPNLDQRHPPLTLVVDRVTHGKGGMPSFEGRLTNTQIRSVATFVATATRK